MKTAESAKAVETILHLFREGHGDDQNKSTCLILLESLLNGGVVYGAFFPDTYTAYFRGDEVVISELDVARLESLLALKLIRSPGIDGEQVTLPDDLMEEVRPQLDHVMDDLAWFCE